MLGIGGFTPLEGFMTHADWQGVCDGMSTAGGLFWPIPITLSCDKDLADSIGVEETVALVDRQSGEIMGVLEVTEKYTIEKAIQNCTLKNYHILAATLNSPPLTWILHTQALRNGIMPGSSRWTSAPRETTSKAPLAGIFKPYFMAVSF